MYSGLVSGRTVYFVDTPGFDDSNGRDEADILEMIAQKLYSISRDGIQLTSVLYLHKITDNRFTASSQHLQRIFEKACGQQAYSMVMLGTTMWEDLVRVDDGIRREEHLRNGDFWGKMMRSGTEAYRLDNTEQSAMPLAQTLAAKMGGVLQLQEELELAHGKVINTAAGQELDRILNEKIDKAAQRARDESHIAEIARLRAELDRLYNINVRHTSS